jgi:hypothetical protein
MCTVWTSVCLRGTDTPRRCSTSPTGTAGASQAHPDMRGEMGEGERGEREREIIGNNEEVMAEKEDMGVEWSGVGRL